MNEPLCACGCGKPVTPKKWGKVNKYIFGHANKVNGEKRRGSKAPERVIQKKCGVSRNGLKHYALSQDEGAYVAGERRVR